MQTIQWQQRKSLSPRDESSGKREMNENLSACRMETLVGGVLMCRLEVMTRSKENQHPSTTALSLRRRISFSVSDCYCCAPDSSNPPCTFRQSLTSDPPPSSEFTVLLLTLITCVPVAVVLLTVVLLALQRLKPTKKSKRRDMDVTLLAVTYENDIFMHSQSDVGLYLVRRTLAVGVTGWADIAEIWQGASCMAGSGCSLTEDLSSQTISSLPL
ncbi:hypothetical protein Q8A73_014449 [Channa argus]|nr:hypothetical protein Q8A73_014449 [Channa argus]